MHSLFTVAVWAVIAAGVCALLTVGNADRVKGDLIKNPFSAQYWNEARSDR